MLDQSSFSKRLREAMDLRQIRQTDLCRMTQIGKSAMSQYLSGAFLPKQRKLYALACALNVSEAWLMGYDVPMARRSSSAEPEVDNTEDFMKSECSASENSNGSRIFSNSGSFIDSGPSGSSVVSDISRGPGISASLEFPDHSQIAATVPEFTASMLMRTEAWQAEGYFYYIVEDESMVNAHIPPGARIFVETGCVPENRELVIFKTDQMVGLRRYIRQDKWILLVAENGTYAPLIYPAEDIETGRLVIPGVARKVIFNL